MSKLLIQQIEVGAFASDQLKFLDNGVRAGFLLNLFCQEPLEQVRSRMILLFRCNVCQIVNQTIHLDLMLVYSFKS